MNQHHFKFALEIIATLIAVAVVFIGRLVINYCNTMQP